MEMLSWQLKNLGLDITHFTGKSESTILKFDDYSIWTDILKSDNYWCKSICSRNHLKRVYIEDIGDNLSTNQKSNLDEVHNILDDKNIDYYDDNPGTTWYDLDPEVGIMIIDDGGIANPLSHYSRIMQILGNTKFKRVYVKSENYEESKELLRGLEL